MGEEIGKIAGGNSNGYCEKVDRIVEVLDSTNIIIRDDHPHLHAFNRGARSCRDLLKVLKLHVLVLKDKKCAQRWVRKN